MIGRKYLKICRLYRNSLEWVSKTKKVDPMQIFKPSDLLVERHIGPSERETQEMLKVCHARTVEDLIRQAIPAQIRDENSLSDGFIKEPVSQTVFLQKLQDSFRKNQNYKCYIGCGFYPTIVPPVIQRNLLENPGWYTAYTPYQAEIAQGRLESLINYQTMVQELTKLDFSNASLLDEASAGGQGFFMAYNVHDGKKNKFFIDENVFIPTQAVIQTKAKFLDIEIIVGNYKEFLTKYNYEEFCGIIVQTPDAKGILHDFTPFFQEMNEKKSDALKIVGSDLLSLTITKAPGDMGADICFGSSQRFGVPMGFGGPYSGFFAVKKEYIRRMPGRIIGISKDKHGQSAYRMALQTREQHIRREKATSNICTAQALLANISAMYAVYHGPHGLRKISERVNAYAQVATRIFENYGFTLLVPSDSTTADVFDTITVTNCSAQQLYDAFLQEKINIRMNSSSQVSLSFSEVSNFEDLDEISRILAKLTGKDHKPIQEFDINRKPFRVELFRGKDYMKQKIFNSIHSETQMMRYLRYLENKDIGLNRSMIPLGSCTMKLNAASEMTPLSWAELNLHPFVPREQAKGYLEIIEELRGWLKEITRFDEVSFQPNSGATGEYAGLLTISQYFRSRKEDRKICLIPKSAHGTNPASAALAGMKVVPVEVEDGKIDMNDFKIKVQKHKDGLAAFMITFPSTAGRYENNIQEMADMVHHFGGQVYMDGANMNAQVGYTSPGFLGADVCHLNLHKTFAIPHGGGGPGMGPICVRKHLAPFLPTHPLSTTHNINSSGTISVSEYGSASILTISYAYIAMLGKIGLKKSTSFAILNANYLMNRLKPYYKVLYLEENERCSHQFIIDIAPLKAKTKVSQEDIAKRLIDYGFHAPTMSFPVAGTLMIEPTQSEDKAQLDRFADAMIKIHHEALTCPEILKNAPYTEAELLQSNWQYSFTREDAAYPIPWVRKRGKYWPPVGRVSNPYGDKNLVCVCPDISSYLE